MKKNLVLLACTLLVLFAFKKINDVISDVGTTIEEVKKITMEQIVKKDFSLPRYTSEVKNACKKLPPGVREATMMSLGKVVKDYIESPQFQKDYTAYIESPDALAGPGYPGLRNDEGTKDWNAEKKKRADQILKSMSNPQVMAIYASNLESQITLNKQMLDLLKESPELKMGKTKEEYQKELADAKMLKDLYEKDKEAFKTGYAEYDAERQVKNLVMQEQNRLERNAQQKQKRIDELKDYKSIIRHQLQQFLDVSADVDFNAALKQQGDKMVFVNPAYESRPAAWKLCFRCGKEAVTGARKFAQEWLHTLK